MAQLALSPALTANWAAAHGHLHPGSARDVNSDIGEEIAADLFTRRDVRRNLHSEFNGLWSPARTPAAARRRPADERLAEYGLGFEDEILDSGIIPSTPQTTLPESATANPTTPAMPARQEPSGPSKAPMERVALAPNLEQRVPSNSAPSSQLVTSSNVNVTRGDRQVAAHSARVDAFFQQYETYGRTREHRAALEKAEAMLVSADDALHERPHCVCAVELLEMAGMSRDVSAEAVVNYAALCTAFQRFVSVIQFDLPCVCAVCGRNQTIQQYLVYHANGLALRVDLCGTCALPFAPPM